MHQVLGTKELSYDILTSAAASSDTVSMNSM